MNDEILEKTKNDIMIFSIPNRSCDFYEIFKRSLEEKPIWIGVDWAKDSGMNRGDVIKRDGNVTHVRFKTVTYN